MRIDTTGRDVTGLPGLWDDTDCEIVQTHFPHPTITSGQHTNGAASIWIRLPDGPVADREWVFCDCRSLHKVRELWVRGGIYAFRTEEPAQ